MDKNACYKIVRETFQNPFDKERFLYFIKNLLNKIDESKAFQARGYVPEIYKNYVKTFERLGTYTDPEGSKIDVVVVYLQKESSLEKARTAQRNFIARYLKDRDQKDAGLVAFVSPNPNDWRFSLVKMDYKFEEGKNGRVKVKEEFTPARRWSFLVGKNENSHTAQSRLVPIVEDDKSNPALKDLEEAFNIEKVTREFFEKYRDLFLWTKETLDETIENHASVRKDFESKGVNTIDFAKKLLGQIVFLYFLQKKGWFGVNRDSQWGTGPKNFLRLLFEGRHGNYENFFNDILEPLFYEALAQEREDDFYSRFNCKIPFLNGGLFDPINGYDWIHTDILLPNDLFSNNYRTKDGDIGNGVLDVFDRYNFTVKEDEPLEKEVAVDPEMLGKVFENLLEVKNRKSKGTYYTPREIVHYMCEQSLVNYLDIKLERKVPKEDIEKLIKYGEMVGENEARVESKGEETETYFYQLPENVRLNAKIIDEKLSSIKICDPAIGSGAFPVGMMSEIVRARNTLSSYINDPHRTLYNFKRDCIQNSLYGVDVDPGAVEIAKLRLWLSLVVDEDDIKQIKPLPNLDYKIMQGNSLLEEFEGIRLFDDKLIATPDYSVEKQIESLKQRQSELQRKYFELHSENKLTSNKQTNLNDELKSVATQLKRLTQSEKVTNGTASLFDVHSEALKKANMLKRLHEDFFETTQKTKKDTIRKNIEMLEWDLIETTLKEQNNISALKKLNEFRQSNTRPFFLWKLHFAEVFQKQSGFDVVIANPPYVRASNIDQGLKSTYKNNYKTAYGSYDIYSLFFEKSFDLLRENGIYCFITSNKFLIADYAKPLRSLLLNDTHLIKLIDLADCKRVFASALVSPLITMGRKFKTTPKYNVSVAVLKDDDISKLDSILFTKTIEPFSIHLIDSSVSFLMKKIELDAIELQKIADVRTGMMGFDYWSLEPFISDGYKKNAIRIVTNGFIDRYTYTWGQKGRLYKKDFNEPYLDLAKASINKTTTDLFLKKKIIIRGVAQKLSANLDEEGYALLVAVHSAIVNNESKYDSRYVLALLNSNLMNWVHLKKFYSARIPEGSLKYPISFIKSIPIKEADIKFQKEIIFIVDKILTITKSNNYLENHAKNKEVKEYEKQIDQIVYKLYNLTPDEIKIIENSNNK